jgi:hypothetical protein
MVASSARRTNTSRNPSDTALRDLIDEERADHGARSRRDRFWSERVDQETMTLPGLLVAMGEQRDLVRLTLRSGTQRIGRVTAVGTDVVAITEMTGTEVLVSIRQIVTVRVAGAALIAVDTEPIAAILRDQLAALTEERAEVRLLLDTGIIETGTLEACGIGVIALRTQSREIVYVAEANIAEVARVAS